MNLKHSPESLGIEPGVGSIQAQFFPNLTPFLMLPMSFVRVLPFVFIGQSSIWRLSVY